LLEANALARIVTDVELDMTQPAKVQEPSMEEILASIRRIIADDEKPAAAGKTVVADAAVAKSGSVSSVPTKPAPPANADGANSQDDIDAMLANFDAATAEEEVRPAQAEEVFELTDEMAVPNATQAAFQKIEPQDDLEFAEIAQVPAIPPDPATVARPSSLNTAAAEILSHSTASAVETAFSSLASTVLTNNARTLEDLVKEMLRPMLKSWLDDNLPGLVERIVKAEIERVSRGRP
jgi:cell pole-organizing protein PopZ